MAISKIQTVVTTLQGLTIDGQMRYLKEYIESIIDECANTAWEWQDCEYSGEENEMMNKIDEIKKRL